MQRRWLIISYFANIDALAPSHHIDDRLPIMKEKGVDIVLLTSPCGARNEEFKHKRVPSPAPSGLRYETRHFLRRKTRERFWFKFWETLLLLPVYPFYFFEKIFLRLDSTWSWSISASVAATFLAIRHRPEVIYSTGGPVSAHIAAVIASSVTGIPHIAEFQDPLVHDYAAPRKCERYYMKNVEHTVFRTARKVLFLTRRAAEKAAERNPSGAAAAAIYPGAFPFTEAAPPRRGERFEIAHFGSLAGSRNLGAFFRALGSLFIEQPGMAEGIRISLYGNNGKNVTRQIEGFPFRRILHVMGKVRREEAVTAMHQADLLLLIQNTDDVSFETIPSKVYEYLQTGRPILGLVYRNDELRQILESRGHVAAEADDDAAIRRALIFCMERWKRGADAARLSHSPYTVADAVDKMLAFANNMNK